LLSHQNENGGWGEDFSSCYDKEYAPRGAEDYGTVREREREGEREGERVALLLVCLLLRLSFFLCLYGLCASDGGLRVSDLCCCYNLLW
jgi:hypothetical protein